ncbi:MAG: hypothetical protein ACE5HX_11240, partial [bacterium]
DIYNTFAAATSSNRTIRANAIEFLDNILSKDLKSIFLAVVEDVPANQILQQANGFLEVSINNRREALEYLVTDSDPWLSACALYEIGKSGLVDEFRALLERAKEDHDILVQETANLVLKQFT